MIMLFFNLKRYSYIIFGVLIFASVPSEGLVGPKNTAVVVGTRTTLNCSSDSNSPVWIWRMPDSTVVAYSSQTRTSPCVVDTPFIGIYNVSTPSTGSSYCNLIILNATSAGAGSYSCSDGTATGASAVLLVLDSPPRCGSDAANDTAVYPDNKNVTMNCSLQFNSTSGWIPSLQWSPTSPPSSGTSYPNINTAYSSLTYPTQASTPIQSYTCRVVYNISVNVDISCSTQPVNVFWPPREVTITGAPGGYILSGSSLICSASGNPSPTYQWFNYTNNLLASVPSLAIWKEGNYTCIASNNINERLYNTSAFQNIVNVELTTPVSGPSRLALILGLTLGLGIPCLILIMVCIMCCCWGERKWRKQICCSWCCCWIPMWCCCGKRVEPGDDDDDDEEEKKKPKDDNGDGEKKKPKDDNDDGGKKKPKDDNDNGKKKKKRKRRNKEMSPI